MSVRIYCSIRRQQNTLIIYEEISMEHKELYRAVELDVIAFASEDVIVTSNGTNSATPFEDEN